MITRFFRGGGGGVSTYARVLRDELRARNIDTLLWTADDEGIDDPTVSPVRCPWEKSLTVFDCIPGLTDFRHAGSGRAIKHVDDRDIDVVHINHIGGGWFSLKALKKLCQRFPCVWTHHDEWAGTNGFAVYLGDRVQKRDILSLLPTPYRVLGYSPYHDSFKSRQLGALLNRHAPQPSLHIAPAPHIRDLLARSGRFDAQAIRVIRNGLSDDQMPESDMTQDLARRSLGLDPAKPTLLIAASQCEVVNKGVHLAAAALGKVERLEHCQIIVLGKNAEAASKLIRGSNVQYLYADQRRKLVEALRSSDVVVLPSMAECFPYMAVESLWCGRPLVSFRVGGFVDILQDGRHGYLAEPYDTDDLARGINTFLHSPAEAQRRGTEGRQWVREHCTASHMADQVVQAYHEAIQRHTAANGASDAS